MGDVQAALKNRMIYQRQEGRFLVFPVYGVQFTVQDVRFILTRPSSYACWASSKPCVRLCLCSLMRTSKGLLVSPLLTSAIITRDTLQTVRRLLAISSRSSFHQCLLECMFSFPVHFRSKFRTFLHEQDDQERESIPSFNLHCEFDGRSNAANLVKKFPQSCWST
jgi:hypothetical protein